jgi:hypothetical protein
MVVSPTGVGLSTQALDHGSPNVLVHQSELLGCLTPSGMVVVRPWLSRTARKTLPLSLGPIRCQ